MITPPQVGFGTWQIPKEAARACVLEALNAGYKHIDCAYAYENQKEVGEAFHEFFATHDRTEYWITGKLWNTNHRPENVKKQLAQDLKDLELDYLDLFIIHYSVNFKHGAGLFPRDVDGAIELEGGYGVMDTWRAMEGCVDAGLARFIGLSNFRPAMINDILSYCKVRPLLNQIESNLCFENRKVIDYCLAQGLGITAYSALGGSYGGASELEKLRDDAVFARICEAHKAGAAEVLIQWHRQRYEGENYSFLVKSQSAQRIQQNIRQGGFRLAPEELEALNSITQQPRQCDPWIYWKIPYFE